VEVVTGAAIERITPDEETPGRLVASGQAGFQRVADLVLVAIGVRPVTRLAQAAGVALGEHGALRVTRAMETSVPGILAAGDCVETWHRVLQRSTYLPLGTTAHKQGRVAGENAVRADGGQRAFAGSLGTQVVKVFELAIARTGLLEAEALAAGFAPLTNETTTWDHKRYYPGARELRLRVTGDRATGRLLGAQIVGDWRGEVAKRIDIFATALAHDMRVADLSDLDLSYTPPLSSPWDPVQMAAQAWEAEHRRMFLTQ
jgi:NADPH-dependent 2,4-dienoyl-CoA reductase/sulfur reductase-like enzyme